jgi:D-alanyl-D-alanine carboxypeptidase/D-alanyl-D-alanine-endopeptidase (penicillin-binding protein 4)
MQQRTHSLHPRHLKRPLVKTQYIARRLRRLTICRVVGVLTAIVSVAQAGVASARDTPLPASVAQLLRAAGLNEQALAVVVRRAADGATIISHQPTRAMQPASTMKVLTSIVGLERLGPAFRGRVELRTGAPIADGVLQGDLVLQGFSNPDFAWRELQNMLETLANQGVRAIAGDLIVDRHHFSPARMDIGVAPFDEAPEFYYNVIPDALNLNANLLQFDVRSDGSSGANSVRAKLTPELDGVSVVSRMSTNDATCAKWEATWQTPVVKKHDNGQIEIELRGAFPKNCSISEKLNVLDRADYVARLFRTQWRALGGRFTGSVREAAAPAGTRLLAQHRARALAEVARDINKTSDNLFTRLVFLSLGAMTPKTPQTPGASSLASAESQVRGWLAEQRIASEGLVLENGSGLSRTERISARQLSDVLRAASVSKWAPEFMASLPIVAVDGSMRNRLRGSVVSERARIKTGGLRNVSAIAGYVPDANGELCVVAAFINDDNKGAGAAARAVLDGLLDWVAREAMVEARDSPLGQYSGQ